MHVTPEMPGPYYKSQERRTDQVTARIPKRMKDDLQRLAHYWTALEREATKDSDVEVTIGDVVVRLLDVGLEGAWEEAREKFDEKTIDKMVGDVEKSLAKKQSKSSSN